MSFPEKSEIKGKTPYQIEHFVKSNTTNYKTVEYLC